MKIVGLARRQVIWQNVASIMSQKRMIRPLVQKLKAYVPGEQPKVRGLVKLNTNENPYPPSPKVLRRVKQAVDGRLRFYPPPSAATLRERLAKFHRTTAARIIVGNGSDELLALMVRAFVEPGRGTVQWFNPSYSLYPVLTDTHGARRGGALLDPDFSLPSVARLRKTKGWRMDAPLTFITTPNAPSGRGYSLKELDALCASLKGVVVLDEAYADFAPGDAMSLVRKRNNVLIARTFSKGYSLCFLRVGYAVGSPALISALDKMRDSYNVNGLAQIAALATLDDLPYYRKNLRRIAATRKRLVGALESLGFDVLPSQANFLLVRPPGPSAKSWLGRLRKRKILVRWFDSPAVRDRLRITIGTDREINALLRAVKVILKR